ncbi:MAG: sporulation integral membrane protein YtvI [Acetivibrionales bacterium]|jgi:sporulation integral membrane protein YtvI
MNQETKNILSKIAIFGLVLFSVTVGVLIAFRLAFFLLPFLIAFALSSLLEPVIKFLSAKLRISRKISAPILLLLLIAIIVTLLVLGFLRLIKEAKVFMTLVPGFLSELYTQIVSLISRSSASFDWLPAEITDNLGSVIANISGMITNFGRSVVKGAYVTAVSFPGILIFTIITIMATYFMSMDRDKISATITRHLPESWMKRIVALKNDLFAALFGYLRAALIMMCVTFAEVFLGLSIIGVKYALLLAFIIAVIDALPILGTGTVLIPWSLYLLFTGNYSFGLYILVLYLVVLVIRHTIEPKVVGHQIGMYPLVTLLATYVGLRLVGFVGLILGPIIFLLIRNIIKTIYKEKTFKEIIGLGPRTGKDIK